MSVLRALGWDHPRCMEPMRACADEWQRTGHGVVEWDARSLEAFGDQPLEEIAARYDVLVIDHPMCGAASDSGCLVPLEDLLPAETLGALQASAVGPSQESYHYEGRTWGLASDAACQVSAVHPGLFDQALPASWPEAIALMRTLGSKAALPLMPAHSLTSLVTLWNGSGLEPFTGGELVDSEVGLEQLEWLMEMHHCGNPAAINWEPPDALAALVSDELAYIPLTYGFISYSARSRPGARARFVDIPGAVGAVLGGAGLAVSASSKTPQQAAEFAAWVCHPVTQRSIVATHGGQPAGAECWTDSDLDADSGDFYSGTRATIERAWVRPRAPWWPVFQLEAGQALTQGLQDRMPARQLLERLSAIHARLALLGKAST